MAAHVAEPADDDRLNPDLPHASIEEVVRILSHPPLIQNNLWFHTLLTDGVEVEYREAKSGETRGGRARLVDFDNPSANGLLLVRLEALIRGLFDPRTLVDYLRTCVTFEEDEHGEIASGVQG